MRRLTPTLLAALIVASIAAWGWAHAAANCNTNQCSYMPIVLKSEPTLTSTPPIPTETLGPATETPTVPFDIPTPQSPCDQNAPSPAQGAQAWMTVESPARYSNTSVCVRLISGSQVVTGATFNATAHYKTKDTNLGSAVTGIDGVGHITFNIGGATSGYTVVVDGTINGVPFATSFTP